MSLAFISDGDIIIRLVSLVKWFSKKSGAPMRSVNSQRKFLSGIKEPLIDRRAQFLWLSAFLRRGQTGKRGGIPAYKAESLTGDSPSDRSYSDLVLCLDSGSAPVMQIHLKAEAGGERNEAAFCEYIQNLLHPYRSDGVRCAERKDSLNWSTPLLYQLVRVAAKNTSQPYMVRKLPHKAGSFLLTGVQNM